MSQFQTKSQQLHAALAWVTPIVRDPRIRRDTAKLMRSSSNAQTLDAARHFANFHRPVLVVWASQDRLFSLSLGERLARAFPRGHLETVENSATSVPCDQPERLATLIDDFLAPQAS
jgi:pimeloyl-ACP methyl ester carboxylesterase